MTVTVTLIVFSALVMLFLIRLAAGQYLAARRTENAERQIRFVDVKAFRNLVDPDEEEYLRNHLCVEDFRRIQRERLRAAIEYVWCAVHNSAVLLGLAEAARHSHDPATARSAEKLIHDAIRLRSYALQIIPRLYLGMLLPGAGRPDLRVADDYEEMTRQVVVLGLQYPARGNTSAL